MSKSKVEIRVTNNTLLPFNLKWTNTSDEDDAEWKTLPQNIIKPKSTSRTMQFEVDQENAAAGFNYEDPLWTDFTCMIRMPNSSRRGSLQLSVYGDYNKQSKIKISSKTVSREGSNYYASFTVDPVLPRRPTDDELKKLTARYPNLVANSVLVTGEHTPLYNCIASSMNVTNAWINPPHLLQDFNKLYARAKTGGTGNRKAHHWHANENWIPTILKSSNAVIDGYQMANPKVNPREKMTHASSFQPLYQKHIESAGLWQSKLGDELRILHNRQGLDRSGSYGKIVVSFIKDPTNMLVAQELTNQVHQLQRLQPNTIFTQHASLTYHQLHSEVSEHIGKEFNEAFLNWEQDIAEQLSHSSDTRDYMNLKTFEKLVQLGESSIPLIINKLKNPKNHKALILYDAIQNRSDMRIEYTKGDFQVFEGEQSRAARSVKKWLLHLG